MAIEDDIRSLAAAIKKYPDFAVHQQIVRAQLFPALHVGSVPRVKQALQSFSTTVDTKGMINPVDQGKIGMTLVDMVDQHGQKAIALIAAELHARVLVIDPVTRGRVDAFLNTHVRNNKGLSPAAKDYLEDYAIRTDGPWARSDPKTVSRIEQHGFTLTIYLCAGGTIDVDMPQTKP